MILLKIVEEVACIIFEVVKLLIVDVVNKFFFRELPQSFDKSNVRAIWRQENQCNIVPFHKCYGIAGVVVSCIVQKNDYSLTEILLPDLHEEINDCNGIA